MNKYRNLRRFAKKRNFSNLNNDYIPIAYYLTKIFADTTDLPRGAITFTCKLIKESGYYEKADNFLSNLIQYYEDHGILVPIKNQEKVETFDDTSVPLKYEIDHVIDRDFFLKNAYLNVELNLLRCVYSIKEPIISTIINKIFLCDSPEDSEISSKCIREIFSTKKVDFLVNKIGLSKKEAAFLLVKFRLATTPQIQEFLDYCNIESYPFFLDILNLSPKDYRRITSENQKLKSYGFLTEREEIAPDLIDCILDQAIEPYFADFLSPLDYSKAYSPESFSVPMETTNVINKLLEQDNPSSILLYGKPGSGKTEYAKMLAKNTGLKTYIYKNEKELHSRTDSLSRLNCYLNIKQEDSLIIIDEADAVLQTVSFSLFGATPTTSKGLVNKMLENNVNKTIWIVNHLNQIDESTRRRFNMSYRFEQMPLSMLRSITKSKMDSLNMNEDLEQSLIELLDKYSVSGSSVDNVIQTIKSLSTNDDKTLINSVKIVLEENAKLLNNNSKRMRQTVSKAYDPNVINTSVSADSIVDMVENAIKFSEKNNSCENGIRMLFYGVSGSGKTELVRYIAEKLNKNILIKRASDILGKYVGENEQNIRDAFNEAAAQDKILLFDEADSFFSDRSQANQNWERTMTNEFLTQMEEFPGILICTTNLKEIMDPAMHRRFHILVEFKPLKKEGIKTLLENYFTSCDFTAEQVSKLENIGTVTPGDFGSLSSRIRFMNQDKLNGDYIIKELMKIQDDKNSDGNHNVIGFR